MTEAAVGTDEVWQAVDHQAMLLADGLRDAIHMASITAPRSLQSAIGASEIGGSCARKKAYKAAGTPPVNFPDPLRALIGTGLHAAMAELFTRLDPTSRRWLVETKLLYRDVPGSADLFDRRRGVVIDWKSSNLRKIKQIRREGPQRTYVVQAHFYAAAFKAMGETVHDVALAFVPLDGGLKDIYVWRQAADPAVADAAIERYRDVANGVAPGPATFPASPNRLCPWCSWWRPDSPDLNLSCPGQDGIPTLPPDPTDPFS